MKRTSSTQNRKLTSLLALSAGALAAPTAADAGIIYSGVINQKVGFSSGYGTDYTLDLPGTADLRLERVFYSVTPFIDYFVQARQWAGYVRIQRYVGTWPTFFFAKRNNAGATWDGGAGNTYQQALIGWRGHLTYSTWAVRGLSSFSDKYIAFMFKDSTQGDALRYGWALMSMNVTAATGADVILHSWAYDDTGAKITMGAIPEPSTAVLLAAGAMVLGASGVRRWRARKHADVS